VTTATTYEHASAGARLGSTNPEDFAVPTGREEEWRFTPLSRTAGLVDGSAAFGGSLSVETRAPGPSRAEQVSLDDPRVGRTGRPIDRAAALGFAHAAQATVVTVPREAILTEPVWITVTGQGSTPAASLLVIDVEAFAKAVVVIDRSGPVSLTDTVEVVVGDGADVTVVSLQDWADDAVHLGHQRHLVGRDAKLKTVVVTLGGSLVRLVPTVNYSAPGGTAEMFGLFFADAGQHLEHRLFVDHDHPNCTSRVVYKGALQGRENAEAHSVWIGDVLIRAHAVGTDTYEINRNLVLTDHARADSVPNLEIETGEIAGAGHASATGRFDDEQMFYLQARGIPADEARRLVVRGFFAEILQQVGLDELEARLVARIEAELEEHGV
jgi:Fe-S cluster assembly protein SufD